MVTSKPLLQAMQSAFATGAFKFFQTKSSLEPVRNEEKEIHNIGNEIDNFKISGKCRGKEYKLGKLWGTTAITVVSEKMEV